MNEESRIKNSIRNMVVGVGGKLFSMVFSFVGRTVFITILGAEYLGVTGLFTNILSMLSLAELGVGSAITYSLYKPLAEKDENKIKALMGLYAAAYRLIGFTVAVLGLSLVPFLGDIIKNKSNIPHLTIIYLMFLTNSVVSYFFAYKGSIIAADQRQYILTVWEYSFSFIQNVCQIVLLVITKDFLLYLAVQILCNFLYNFCIAKQADKIYPFLKNGKKVYLDKGSKNCIYKNIGAMMSHKMGGVIVFSTSNILIATFVGIYWVGLYSNYSMIIGIVNSFLGQIFSAINGSIGQLNAKETREKSYSVFCTAFFINFWIYGFCAISFWVLFNPFITMWIGSHYVMDKSIVLIIVLNFFITGMRKIVLTYKDTMGLFWNDRYKPLFEAGINLIVSIILVQEMGIVGVFLGAFISTMTTCFWVEPYILYKHGFKKSVRVHFLKYAMYTGITITVGFITELACSIFTAATFLNIAGRGIFCLLIPNAIFTILFFRTNEFKHVYGIVTGIARNCLQIVHNKIA